MNSAAHIETAGAPLSRAKAAMILLHGRGATAEGMLELAQAFAQPDIAYLAPQAPGRTWYPYSFLAPLEQNEPHLSRALAQVGGLVEDLAQRGFGPEGSCCSASLRAGVWRLNSRRAMPGAMVPSSA
jgi:predicted esterase